jgi:hypothetical protein
MQFSASQALSEAFQILTSRFGALIGIALIFYAMLIAAAVALGGSIFAQIMATMPAGGGEPSPEVLAGGMGLGLVVFYLLIYAIQFAQQLALTRACSDRHSSSIGDAIVAGFKGVPTMFGAVILLGIVAVVAVIVLSMVFAAITMGTQSAALGVVLVVLAIIGCVYLFARLSMLNPVVAIDEERNPITAISRSWQLTAGNAGRLVLLFFGALLLAGGLAMVLFLATIGVPQPGAEPSGAGMIAFLIAMVVFGLTVGLYFVALIVAIHRQLAGPAPQAASVFE